VASNEAAGFAAEVYMKSWDPINGGLNGTVDGNVSRLHDCGDYNPPF